MERANRDVVETFWSDFCRYPEENPYDHLGRLAKRIPLGTVTIVDGIVAVSGCQLGAGRR